MRIARNVLAVGGVTLALTLGLAPAAGAQDAPVATDGGASGGGGGGELAAATIADALGGQLAGVEASATGGFGGDDRLDITLTVTNDTDSALVLAVPRGALFETDDPTNQTAVVAGPTDEDVSLAAVGTDPTISIAPGEHEVTLAAFCAQANDVGPEAVVPMTFAGVATAPLPRVMHNVAALAPDHELAQEAVWWVTDRPVVPVRSDLAPLLEGVDVDAFAAEPHRVVLDEQYTPEWRRVEFEGLPGAATTSTSSGGGLGTFVLIGVLATFGVVVAIIVALTRGAKAPVPVRAGGSPAGWYPDPGDARYVRYWNGARWTDQVRGR